MRAPGIRRREGGDRARRAKRRRARTHGAHARCQRIRDANDVASGTGSEMESPLGEARTEGTGNQPIPESAGRWGTGFEPREVRQEGKPAPDRARWKVWCVYRPPATR